jgi:hypothetical protein
VTSSIPPGSTEANSIPSNGWMVASVVKETMAKKNAHQQQLFLTEDEKQ